MSRNKQNLHFLYKNELATRYNICLDTFNVWIEKIEDKIPMYVKKQRKFAPSQVHFFDTMFIYNPNQLELDL
jgi:hypothetical protein